MNYSDFVAANAHAFLQSRHISFDMLARLASEQGFDDAQVLLTSSPVHGIATATSDVDLICVTPQPVSKGQMATQIHRDGQHCELLPIGADDLARAFADLALLSRRALPQRLAGYQRWDAGHAVRKKYLERIVYAVDTAGHAPHVAHLPALVPIAAAQEYDAFHQSRVCAVLAVQAGEPGAAQGYLLNACLSAMAAALSLGGWVLSNKKWTLRRWRDAAAPHMRVVDASLHAQLTALWASMSDPAATARQIARLDELDVRLGLLLNAPSIAAALPRTASAHTQAALDKRSAFLIGDDGMARLAATVDAGDPPPDLAGLAALAPEHAAALLRHVRSGMLSFSLVAGTTPVDIEEDAHATVE